MLVVLTNPAHPRLGPRPRLLPRPLDPDYKIPHEPRMPLIFVVVQQVIRPLPCKQVHHQLPHLVILHAAKRLKHNPRVRRRRHAIRVLGQLGHLLHNRVLAALNAEFVDEAVQVQQPEVGRFDWLDGVDGFVVEAARVQPV